MNIVSSRALSKAPNVVQERKKIGVILRSVTGEKRAPHFCLGYLGGVWTFKCVGSVVGSDERFFRVVDKNIEVIKQTISDKIDGNGKI